MGVSTADLQSYLSMCSGYIYAILALLVVAIVVIVLAGRLKKGVRGFARGSAVVAWLLCAVVIVTCPAS